MDPLDFFSSYRDVENEWIATERHKGDYQVTFVDPVISQRWHDAACQYKDVDGAPTPADLLQSHLTAMVFRAKPKQAWVLVCVLNFGIPGPGPYTAYVFHTLRSQQLPEIEQTTQGLYKGKPLRFLYAHVSLYPCPCSVPLGLTGRLYSRQMRNSRLPTPPSTPPSTRDGWGPSCTNPRIAGKSSFESSWCVPRPARDARGAYADLAHQEDPAEEVGLLTREGLALARSDAFERLTHIRGIYAVELSFRAAALARRSKEKGKGKENAT